VTNGTNDAAGSRKVIHATCVIHPGTPNFTNLELVWDGFDLVLNPHATGACTLLLNETEARELRSVIDGVLG
jgi:hypothetical protein